MLVQCGGSKEKLQNSLATVHSCCTMAAIHLNWPNVCFLMNSFGWPLSNLNYFDDLFFPPFSYCAYGFP